MKGLRVFSLIFTVLLVALQSSTSRGATAGPVCAMAALSPQVHSLTDPSYFGSGPNWVWFLQWTESRDSLTGQFQEVYVTSDAPLKVQAENAPINGIRNGSDVTLKVGGPFFGETWTGTLRGNILTLTVPQGNGLLATVVLRNGTVEDYNRVASAFRLRIEQLAQQAALQRQREAQQAELQRQREAKLASKRMAVIDASGKLAATLRNLAAQVEQLSRDTRDANFKDVVSAYARDWTRMQENYQKLQADAAKRPFDCYQLSTVKYDLNTLEYDMSSIRYDNGSFGYATRPISNDKARVTNSEQLARSALANLQAMVAANVLGKPGKATVYLENYSTGAAYFYVDGRFVCKANSDSPCEIELTEAAPHHMSAVTSYSSASNQTPDVVLKIQQDRIYRFLACGETGTFGQNCGLFAVNTPTDVEAASIAAEQQVRQSQAVIQSAEQQKDIFNQEAEQLLKQAKDFVAGLTCSQ